MNLSVPHPNRVVPGSPHHVTARFQASPAAAVSVAPQHWSPLNLALLFAITAALIALGLTAVQVLAPTSLLVPGLVGITMILLLLKMMMRTDASSLG